MESYPKSLTSSSLLVYWQHQYRDHRERPPRGWVSTDGRNWTESIDDLVNDCVASDMSEHILRLQKIQKLTRKGNKIQPYQFVTLNYANEVTPAELVEKVRKWQATKWSWGSNRIQRFEFTGKKGYHPHIHMMIFTSKKRSQIIKELSNKTKLGTNFIDVLNGRYQDHIDYIKGIKQDSKAKQMEADDAQRIILGIDEYEEFSENG
jgi:hypothetical protein